MKRKLFIAIHGLSCALLMLSAVVRGESIYITQTTQGSNTGGDPANAHAVTWFNTATNWGEGSGQIGSGDTVRLSGTIHSQLVIQGSGSSGMPISILFESGAKLSAPYWGVEAGSAIYANGKSYITIDGNGVGIVENTANGTDLANQQLSSGIWFNGGTNVTIKRITVQNLYVRIADSNDGFGSAGLSIRGINLNNVSNLLIDSNTITYCKYGLIIDASGANAITVSNNFISRSSTMVVIAKGDTVGTSGVVVTGNTFANGNYWDFPATAGDLFHGDGLHMWTSTGPFADVTITRNNMLTDWGGHTTGAIFLEGNYGSMTISNNLLGTLAEKLEAVLNISGFNPSGTTATIYNNTLIGQAATNTGGNALYLQGAHWTSATVKNNIFYNFYAGAALYTTQAVSALHFDYNDYYLLGNISGRMNPATTDQDGTSGSLADWATYLGSKGDEANGRAVNPLFVSATDFHLQFSSPCKDAGLALGNMYDTDMNGITRPQGLGWDIGAYESATNGVAAFEVRTGHSIRLKSRYRGPSLEIRPTVVGSGDRRFDLNGNVIGNEF